MRGDIVLFLGLVTVVGGGIIVAAVLFFGGGGGGDSACDDPLPPLGDTDISQLAFQTEDAGLARVAQAATTGDLEAAESAFFGDVHNFTHDVDAPLREADEGLAKDLCQAVVRIEKEFFSDEPRTSIIATEATLIRDLIQDAAEALGYARPGG